MPEGDNIPEVSKSYGRSTLEFKKYAGKFTYTEELEEDAIFDIARDIEDDIVAAVANTMDYLLLVAQAATDGFDGILNMSGTTPVAMDTGDTTYNKINYKYLKAMQGKLDDAKRTNAVFVMGHTVRSVVDALEDSNGRPLRLLNWSGKIPVMDGDPVYAHAYMPQTSDSSQAGKNFVIYGNLKYAVRLGVKRDIRIVPYSIYDQDKKAIKVAARMALAPIWASDIVVLQTASS